MFKRLATLAIVAVAPVCATAQTTANVTVTPFVYQVIDLDPNDGLTASLTWGDWTGAAAFWTFAQGNWVIDQGPGGYTDYRTSFSQTGQNIYRMNDASTSWQATDGAGNATLQFDQGDFGTLQASHQVEAGQQVIASIRQSRTFTLTPGTAVDLMALLNGGVSVPEFDGSFQVPPWASMREWHARSYFAATMTVGGEGQTVGLAVDNSWQAPWDAAASNEWQDMYFGGIWVNNTTGQDKTFRLDLTVNIELMQALAPIPEPGSWALMGAGLLAVGAIARRRRARG